MIEMHGQLIFHNLAHGLLALINENEFVLEKFLKSFLKNIDTFSNFVRFQPVFAVCLFLCSTCKETVLFDQRAVN